MTIAMEVGVIALINLLSLGITMGIFVGRVNLIIHRLSILEAKQDKYNGLQERMIRTESSANSAHKRIDKCELSVGCKNHKGDY